MSASERFHAAVQQELNEERAAVLGRTGRRLEESLARCRALGRQLEAVAEGPARARLLADYRAARNDSEEWRWRLCLQREVLGLTEHRWVDRVYPPPPAHA